MEYLQYAFVYLAAAVVFVPLANRLGLGSVLGYLLAGIVIGPTLGLVGSETETIKHFAEFGVVMMLFLVGLELQPAMLWRMRGSLLGLGGLQVLGTTLLFFCAALALGLSWRESLAVGMTLALSSTAIVLQTLNEKGWTKSSAGQSSFAVLLFQDIAVIPMLALLPLLAVAGAVPQGDSGHHGGGLHDLPGWVQGFAILAVIAAIIVAGRFLIRPVFRFIAQAKLREIFTAAALLLVIGIAMTMTWVGLSPALGTFLAGVVLSDSEYRHELESDIDPFKGLLLGLFFITVGAGIDFGTLLQQPGLISGLALALMAVKFSVLMLLAVVFKLGSSDRWLFALALAQAGEFAFVLFGFALASGVLPQDTVQLLTLVVTISMLLTPGLFILYDKVIAPRALGKTTKEPDVIEEQGTVILAGVGRFGQIVARMLLTNGYKVVVLDHDPEMIEMMDKVGIKAYYGDATRPDLLHAAGIEEAKLVIAAMDDIEKQNLLVEHVAHNYPHCRILARAITRHHVYELEKRGAHQIERELFEGSLAMAEKALVSLGRHPFRARQMAHRFRKHDCESLNLLRDHWNQGGLQQGYLEAARSRAEALVEIMHTDREDQSAHKERSWEPPPKSDASL